MAGGVALNCMGNSKIFATGGFDNVWVQPAAGDSGTAIDLLAIGPYVVRRPRVDV